MFTCIFTARINSNAEGEEDNTTAAVLSNDGKYTPTASSTEISQDKGTYRIDYNLDNDGVKYMTVLVTLKRGGAGVKSAEYTIGNNLTFKRINKDNYKKSNDYASRYELLTRLPMYNSSNLYVAEVNKAQASYLFLINYRGESGNYNNRIVFPNANDKKGEYEISGSNLDMALTNNGDKIYTYAYSVDYFKKTWNTTDLIKKQYSNKTVSMTTDVSKPVDANGDETTISGINLHTTNSGEKFAGGHDKKSGYQSDIITSNIQFYNKSVSLDFKFSLNFKASFKEKTVTKVPSCTKTYEGDGIYTNLFGFTKLIKFYGDKNLSASGHETTTYIINNDCKTQRYRIVSCKNCHTELERVQAFKEHSYNTHIDKEPSCSEKGKKTLTCADCGESHTEDIPMLSHTYIETDTYVDLVNYSVEEYFNTHPTNIRSSAPCLDNIHIKICKKCWHIDNYRKITPKPHTYDSGTILEPATCLFPGVRSYTCTVCKCGYKTEAIPALGHDFPSKYTVSKPATCEEQGSSYRRCRRKNCGMYDYKSIPALGHEYENDYDTYVPQTCIHDGKAPDKKCIRCSRSITGKVIKADGVSHKWGKAVITTEPTEKSPGLITYTCQLCKQTKTKTIPATGTDDSSKNPDDKKDDKKDEPSVNKISGVGTISKDGKTLTDEKGSKYRTAETVTQSQLKKNLKVADKKSGGKYQIIKTIKDKKTGKVTGGYLKYIAPYNKNCKTISATYKVKIGGVIFTVTVIGKNCAKGCKNLRKVVIGKKVTTIGANAFNGCSKLTSVRITSKNLKKVGKGAFKGVSPNVKVSVPKTRLKKYSSKLKSAGLPKKSKITEQ